MNVHFREFIGHLDWGWVNQQVPILRSEDTSGIMAIDEDTNTTIAACIMDNWTDSSVQCHFMVTTPLVIKHGFLETCLDYVFNERNRTAVYGLVPSKNVKARKFNKHMGFTEKCVLEKAYSPDEDYIIMELKKENCNYLVEHKAVA